MIVCVKNVAIPKKGIMGSTDMEDTVTTDAVAATVHGDDSRREKKK